MADKTVSVRPLQFQGAIYSHANFFTSGLAQNTWYRVPFSNMTRVLPIPTPDPVESTGSVVMSTWSGAAFDSTNDRLIVWGGGHADYAGNEVYIFDLNSLTWTRFNDPTYTVSANVGDEAIGYYRDVNGNIDYQQPRARHTYNSLEYYPSQNKFLAFGATGIWQSGQVTNGVVNALDLSTKTWTQSASTLDSGVGMTVSYDSLSGTYWFHSNGGYLQEFNPATNTWTSHGSVFTDPGFNGNRTSVVHPKKRYLLGIGHINDAAYDGKVLVWNLNTGTSETQTAKVVQTTGFQDITSANYPGLAYDPYTENIMSYMGGNLFSLSLETSAWSKIQLSPSNTVTPTNTQVHGTFGRFRYSTNKNVYVLVNDTTEDVYIYKPTTVIHNTVSVSAISDTYTIQTPSVNFDWSATASLVSGNMTVTSASVPFNGFFSSCTLRF